MTMHAQGSESFEVKVHLLFAKEDASGFVKATVISLAKNNDSEGWPDSIKNPIDKIDFGSGHLKGGLLNHLLPCSPSPHNTNIEYLDEEPVIENESQPLHDSQIHGNSHLLSVLLGLYALGADQHLGSHTFRETLSNWFASAAPNPDGTLSSVSLLPLKLEALYRRFDSLSNRNLSDSISPPLNLLLPFSNRQEIQQYLASKNSSDPSNTWAMQCQEENGTIQLFHDKNLGQPWLHIHFAETFEEALNIVFPKTLLHRFQSSLRNQQLKRKISKLLIAGLMVSLAAWSIYSWADYLTPGVSLRKLDNDKIQGISAKNEVAWNIDFPADILLYGKLNMGGGRNRFWVSLFNNKPNSGWLYLLDDRGKVLFQHHPGKEVPYEKLHKGIQRDFNLQFAPVISADVLPERGTEIIASAHCDWYPSKVCILSEKGDLLKVLWHPGAVSADVVHIPGTSIVVFHGPNNGLLKNPLLEKDHPPRPNNIPYYYTIHAYDIAALPDESEAFRHIIPSLPDAKPVFHYTVVPRGSGTQSISLINYEHPDGRNEQCVQLHVAGEEQYFIIDRKGSIIDSSRAPNDPDYISLLPSVEVAELQQTYRNQINDLNRE